MINLAQWAMRSRKQAILAALICLATPLLFWLGAAILALCVLRQGLEGSRLVVMWASLPAIAWFAVGDPLPLITAVGASSLALVLRQTVSLDRTLIVAAALGVAIYWWLPMLMPEVLELITQSASEMVKQALAHQSEMLSQFEALINSMIQGFIAAIYLLVIVLSLLLGRYWQSKLYNPGGFGQEFKQLRMSPAYSVLAMFLLFGTTSVTPDLAGMAPALTVPMMLAGLALLHSVASNKGGAGWMVPVYVALFVFGPYLYTLLILIAFADSLLNFRARLKDTA